MEADRSRIENRDENICVLDDQSSYKEINILDLLQSYLLMSQERTQCILPEIISKSN